MSWDFYNTREISRAAKPHRCDECLKPISVGEPYRAWSGRWDGDFCSGHVHGECQDWAHAVMADEPDGRPFLWDADPEEWLVEWKEPSPELLARLPTRWAKIAQSIGAAA